MSKYYFLGPILTTNTLGTNVHKMYECHKNPMPYCNVKSFLNEIFGNFGPLIKYDPH
jgi:hypothetical protein